MPVQYLFFYFSGVLHPLPPRPRPCPQIGRPAHPRGGEGGGGREDGGGEVIAGAGAAKVRMN